MKSVVIILIAIFSFQLSANEVDELKEVILETASKYTGRPDKDFKIQNELMPLVDKLVSLAPQKPVNQRLELLDGAWMQIWGAYDYRNNDRGVDSSFANLEEIYQVVSKDGYYYNVAPLYSDDKESIRISLLRGAYKQDNNDPNRLNIRFTKFKGVSPAPRNIEIWKLAELEENRQITENRITIVPTLIVRLFFGRGHLREIYTDEDIRITITNTNGDDPANAQLYVFKRVNES